MGQSRKQGSWETVIIIKFYFDIHQITGSVRVSPQSLWESICGPLAGFRFVTPQLPVRSAWAGGTAGSVHKLVQRRSPSAPTSVP